MHQAHGFTINQGHLWRLSTKPTNQVSQKKCIPRKEGFIFVLNTHWNIGHFKSVDILKLHIHETTFWPGMDTNCKQAVTECLECKHFGPAHHNTLLQPIQHSQPFSPVCSDYLSLPMGLGSYKKVGLYVNIYLGFVWGFKLKTTGTAKSTIDLLSFITDNYINPDSFMADCSSHFCNKEVDKFCVLHSIQHITTSTYVPWCNSLIKSLNQLLLGRLQHLCAPDMDTLVDNNKAYKAEDLPKKWPLHFDKVIWQINDQIHSQHPLIPS